MRIPLAITLLLFSTTPNFAQATRGGTGTMGGVATMGFSAAAVSKAVVQACPGNPTTGSSSTTVTSTCGATPTTGNILVAFPAYSQYSTTRTVSAPDGTWTKVGSQTNTSDSLDIWWHPVVAGAATSYTFTINGSSTDFSALLLVEVSGASTSNPIGTNFSFATGSTAASGSPVTISTASLAPPVVGALPLSAETQDQGSNDNIVYNSVSTGWTLGPAVIPSYHGTAIAYSTPATSLAAQSMSYNIKIPDGGNYVSVILYVN